MSDNTRALPFYICSHAVFAILVLVLPISWYPKAILILAAFGLTLKQVFLIVPAQTSLVLENSFDGTLREVSAGLVVKYPWEQAPLRNWLELNTLSVDIGGEFVAKNGPRVDLRGKLFFRIVQGEGTRVVKHTEHAFFPGIERVCSSFLSDYVASREARDVRERSKELEQELLAHLEDSPRSLRRAFGVEPTLVSISKVTFDDAYQKIRTRTSAAQELMEIAEHLKTGTMSEAEALEAAMLVSGDVKKRILDVRGNNALTAQLIAIAKAIQ